MKRIFATFLLLPALLVACPQAPTPEVKPPVLEQPPFKPSLLGSLTVELGADGKGTSAQFKPSAIQNQTLSPVPENTLTFTALPLQTIDVVTPSQRYLMATFNIASTVARSNLTLVAYAKNGNTGGSAFKEIQNFVGGAVNVNNIVPINAMKTSGCPGAAAVCVDNSKADLQIYTRSEIATLTTASAPPNGTLLNAGEGLLQYAYVARSSTTSRSIAASGTGTVTLALQVPPTEDRGGLAYRYSMTFLVFTDNVARVTESTSEQGTNSGAATRATGFGGSPQIATMCGTTIANQTFIPGVRTVGVGVDTAWMGGSFYDDTGTAANVAGIVGNTEKTIAGSSLLLSATGRFKALGTATLSTSVQNIASSTTAAGGNYGITSTGDLTIRPKVNLRSADSFTYQISDGTGTCTSPNISATIAAPSNTVWYIDSSAAAIGSDGRSNSPFQSVSSLNVVATPTTVTAAGDFISIKGSTGNSTLVLKNNQQVIGGGEALVVGAETLINVGTPPTISSPMTVATGNTIKGLTFGGLNGTVGGTLTVSNASIAAGAARAINLTGGTLAVVLTKVDSSGGTNNISLTNTAGSLAINGTGTTAGSGGVLSGATGHGIVVSDAANVTIKNLNLSGSQQNGVNWTASSGTSNLTLTKVAVSGIGSAGTGNGLFGVMSGTATGVLTANGGSSFNTAVQSGIDISTQTNTTSVLQARITNASLTNNGATQVVVNFYASGAGSFAEVSNNSVTGTPSAIAIGSQSTASTQAKVNSNTIDNGNGSGIGIQFDLSGTNVGNLIAQSNNNTITNGGQYGFFNNLNPIGGRFDLTTTGNNIAQTSANASMGMLWNMTSTSSNATLCAKITGNTVASGVSATYGMRVRPRAGTPTANTLLIEGISPSPATTAAAVQTYLGSPTNTVSGGSVASISAVFISNVVSQICNTPTF
jgi:trimeric autotransporter adhesin